MTLTDILLPSIQPIPQCVRRYGFFQDQHLSPEERSALGRQAGMAASLNGHAKRRRKLVRALRAYASAYGLFSLQELRDVLDCSKSTILSIFATELAGLVEFDERRQKMIYLGEMK